MSNISNWTPAEFEPFSLSRPLAEQLKTCFARIYSLRRFSETPLGWDAAEHMVLNPESELTGSASDDAAAKREEEELQALLPQDPLSDNSKRDNIPLCTFVWLVRRLVTCPRNCLVSFAGRTPS